MGNAERNALHTDYADQQSLFAPKLVGEAGNSSNRAFTAVARQLHFDGRVNRSG